MRTRLLPCPGCNRHVRVSDASCPFCGEGVAGAFENVGPVRLPKKRLGRAAKFAFGAAVAGAMTVSGCGDDSSPPADSGRMDSGAMPPYGAPPGDTGTPPDSGDDAGDAGDPDDAGDAGDDADMIDAAPAPEYGAPPEP